MKPNNALQVFYDGRLVGMLAMTADHRAAFQYSEKIMKTREHLSPAVQKFIEYLLFRETTE